MPNETEEKIEKVPHTLAQNTRNFWKKFVPALPLVTLLLFVVFAQTIFQQRQETRSGAAGITTYPCGRCSDTKIGCWVSWQDSSPSCSRTGTFLNTQYICPDSRCSALTPTPGPTSYSPMTLVNGYYDLSRNTGTYSAQAVVVGNGCSGTNGLNDNKVNFNSGLNPDNPAWNSFNWAIWDTGCGASKGNILTFKINGQPAGVSYTDDAGKVQACLPFIANKIVNSVRIYPLRIGETQNTSCSGVILNYPTPTPNPITFPNCSVRAGQPLVPCPAGYACLNTCNPAAGMSGCAQFDVCKINSTPTPVPPTPTPAVQVIPYVKNLQSKVSGTNVAVSAVPYNYAGRTMFYMFFAVKAGETNSRNVKMSAWVSANSGNNAGYTFTNLAKGRYNWTIRVVIMPEAIELNGVPFSPYPSTSKIFAPYHSFYVY